MVSENIATSEVLGAFCGTFTVKLLLKLPVV
jgi:hypothetical protein